MIWRGLTLAVYVVCRKRLTDMETKLRMAVQEKTTASFEKANLERQLKQQSQQLSQKKDALDSKKRLRESIMVVRSETHGFRGQGLCAD